MFLTLGPLANRATGRVQRLAAARPARPGAAPRAADVAGGVREASFCQDYYDETRARAQPWMYSFICCLAPLAALFGSLVLAALLIGEGPPPPAGVKCPSDASSLPAVALLDIGGRLHFAAAQVVFLVFSLAVGFISVVAARRVAAVHASIADDQAAQPDGKDEAAALAQDAALARARTAAQVKVVAAWLISAIVLGLVLSFGFHDAVALVLRPFMQEVPGYPCNGAAAAFERSLTSQAIIGAIAAVASITALATAVSAIAFRFETDDINGRWADSYVLREKLNLLLTLFFVGSALLVIGNLALDAMLNWSINTAGAFPLPEPKTQTDEAATIDALRNFAKAITGFSGATSSALLIALFVPAFMVLIDDIGVAGQTHASADIGGGSAQYVVELRGDGAATLLRVAGAVTQSETGGPTPPYRVAGWKKVKEWKDKHGLSMSMTDLSASFLAVAAPLLSAGFIDMSKAVVGAH